MVSLVRFAYVMAMGRAVSGWRLEGVLLASILVAVSLMASGVIFSDLLSNSALRETLARSELDNVNFTVRTFSSRDDPADVDGRIRAFQDRDHFVEQNVTAQFQPFLKDQSRYLETATFFFQGRPHLETDRDIRPRGQIFHLTEMPNHIRVLEGQFPTATGAHGQPVNVAVDKLGATLLGLEVGESMEVFPAATFDDSPPFELRIAAVYEVLDPSDDYWHGLSHAWSRKDDRWTLVPLYADEEALLSQVLGAFPSLYAETTWHFSPDQEKLKANRIVEVQRRLGQIERSVSIGLKNSSYSIRLDTLLRDFEEELLLSRLPLLLMLFLVTGILVYYLSLVSGLVVRSRSVEFAMLKSRGATVGQLGLLGLGEGLLVSIPAVVAGPFIALGTVKLLGFIFFRLSGTQGLVSGTPVELSLEAFLLGIAGGGLAVLVFSIATLSAARLDSAEARQNSARPPTSNLFHRYYLDVALLAIIGLVWWQLQNRGTFLVQSLGSSELSVDYTLLLGPTLGLVAAGLIVLRLFPLAAGLLARLAGPFGPTWLVHVIRHLSRDPMTPAMLVILVMLATSLGVMGSVFSTTLAQGQRERAMYEAGADLRVEHNARERTDSLTDELNELGGISAKADAYRTSTYLTSTGFGDSGTLLAVDTDSIAEVAWFRDDFGGGLTLDELVEALKEGLPGGTSTAEGGISLPANASALAVWARAGGTAQSVSLWARLKDSEGRVADAWIGNIDTPRWQRLVLELTPEGLRRQSRPSRPPEPELNPPFTLVSLLVQTGFLENDGGAIFLGRAAAVTPSGEVVLQDFGSTEGWAVIEDFRQPGVDSLETSRSAAGEQFDLSSRFSWAPGGTGLTGIRAGGAVEPIPALVSSQFLDGAGVEVGETVVLSMSTHALLLEVVAEVRYFPTLDPEDLPFVVVDLSRLRESTLILSPRPFQGPNELWLSLEGNTVDPEEVAATLRAHSVSPRELLHASTMAELRLDRPLVNAGWGALLVLLFLVVALASASGLMLFSHLDARERQTEFAMLRTLGVSRGQMTRVVWVSLLILVVCGVGLGTILGWMLGSSMLPLMEVAEEGSRVTPSLLLTADWRRILVSYVILSGVTGLCGLWLTWLTSKLQLQQVLRLGE